MHCLGTTELNKCKELLEVFEQDVEWHMAQPRIFQQKTMIMTGNILSLSTKLISIHYQNWFQRYQINGMAASLSRY